ncbi:MAG TPA: glycosyltransferase [Solirubrobacteraceae bacterium]
MRVVLLGLSITSTWGNGHATNYRALMRGLVEAGHEPLFLERDVPWYAAERDLPRPPYGRTCLYDSLQELDEQYAQDLAEADLVIVGSYVPEGVSVGEWALQRARSAVAFYDIDTPVTLAKLARGEEEYISAELVRRYDLYLSFTGGPTLQRIERELGSPRARAFHCLVDPHDHRPLARHKRGDLGYLGTYSPDRQDALERLLLEPARRDPSLRCVVAGPSYPAQIDWPANVERIEHVPAERHAEFYAQQRLTLNVTRADMLAAGFSPSVRLFEAAACAVPVVSDRWAGLESFFDPDGEIVIADSGEDVCRALRRAEGELHQVGLRARRRVLREHTAAQRVRELEQHAAMLEVCR